MGYGGNMKGSRLADVLDEKYGINKEFWNKIFAKMNILLVRIESTNPSIDDLDLRFVSDRIEYCNSKERILDKQEMLKANELWRKYNVG